MCVTDVTWNCSCTLFTRGQCSSEVENSQLRIEPGTLGVKAAWFNYFTIEAETFSTEHLRKGEVGNYITHVWKIHNLFDFYLTYFAMSDL